MLVIFGNNLMLRGFRNWWRKWRKSFINVCIIISILHVKNWWWAKLLKLWNLNLRRRSSLILPFLFLVSFRKHAWGIVVIGFIVAISIEWYALATDRWAYNVYMPIIPFLSVGLTPTIQLALLGLLSFKIQERFFPRGR